MASKKPSPSKSAKKSTPEQGDLFTEERPKKKNTQEEESLSLGIYAERAYLDYAISVVKGRA